MPILETNWPAPAPQQADWARHLCHGSTWPGGVTAGAIPRYEWMPVLNPGKEVSHNNKIAEAIVGVSGTAVLPPTLKDDYPISHRDNPFLHPFGLDFEFLLAPDKEYVSLLAQSNITPKNDRTGRDFYEGLRYTKEDLGLDVVGVLGVEMDEDLAPPAYRPGDGDRVAVFGRWIVDAGHEDFHAEIHPPLLLAAARPSAGTGTSSTVLGRAFLVSQEFSDGNLFTHLVTELKKRVGFPGACKLCVSIPFLGRFCIPFPPGIPCSRRMEAHPAIKAPFSGDQHMSYTVRPARPRSEAHAELFTKFHFTVRTGVTVELTEAPADGVLVAIDMNDRAYHTPAPPAAHHWDLSIPDLIAEIASSSSPYWQFLNFLIPPSERLRTDRRNLAPAPGISDAQLTSSLVSALPARTPVTVDDHQPFPIIGRLDVEWETPPPIQ